MGTLELFNWLGQLHDPEIDSTLSAAAILASQEWLDSMGGETFVSYNKGQDFERSKTSQTGVFVSSVLLALALFILMTRALYISFTPAWTSTFDSSRIMRLGAARAVGLLLQVYSQAKEEKIQAALAKNLG